MGFNSAFKGLRLQGCQPNAPAAFTPQQTYMLLIPAKRMSQPKSQNAAGRVK